MPSIILIAHNIRSAHNVGSIFRSSDGFGVKEIIVSGYTPYPDLALSGIEDNRLPHEKRAITKKIHKTALGAELSIPFRRLDQPPIDELRQLGYQIVALEQHPNSIKLSDFKPSEKIALLLGEEVAGVNPELLTMCDYIIEIPMSGQKESFNVAVSAGIALYAITVV